MNRSLDLFTLIYETVIDPVAGGRAVIALRPPTPVRWMLLVAAILVSVVLMYSLPVMTGQVADMPAPWAFAGAQLALNVLVVALVAYVGRMFNGTGNFDDALLLMAWLQSVTVALFIVQLFVLIVVPALNFPITMISVAISVWMMTGFICALHGFQSRLMVLVASISVFTMTVFALSVLLLMLGFDLSGVSDV